MKTEVIIAERNEPDLDATVANIRDNSACSVRVISDEHGRGPQRCRHRGIMQSEADVVIVMDGHMRVKYRTLDAAADYVSRLGNKVACLRCHHSPTIDWTGTPYGGARLALKTHWDEDDPTSEPQAMAAKWRKDPKPGKIGAVMGACYVFRRDWYICLLYTSDAADE